MKLYYPYKPEKQNEIQIILFLKEEVSKVDTIIFSWPNNDFEHAKLLKKFVRKYPQFHNILKFRYYKGINIYEIAMETVKSKVATFANVSSTPYEQCILILPYHPSSEQKQAILSYQYLFDSYKMPEAAYTNLHHNVIPLKEYTDIYSYLNTQETPKQKRL